MQHLGKMKIGIDARFLTHPQVGGFKTYTRNLILALGQIDSENEYVVYIDREPEAGSLPEFDNFTFRVVPLTIPFLGMPYREQVELPRRLWEDDLDLIHFLCNTAPANINGKYIVTLHDIIQLTTSRSATQFLKPKKFKKQIINAYSKWTIMRSTGKASRIITVSDYERSRIAEQLDIGTDNICVTHLAPNPIFEPAEETTKAEWRRELGRDIGLPASFLLGIGYEARKNIPLLMKAFARLAPTYRDLSLVVVAAQDKAREEFEILASELELADRIVVLGSQTQTMLSKLYNLADVFVYPSERESFGLPPVEAVACGAPTIAMNMSSLPEILQNGALMVDGKDVQVWADAIESVVMDEEIRKNLTARGLARAAELNWQVCAQKTIDVYEQVVRENQVGELAYANTP